MATVRGLGGARDSATGLVRAGSSKDLAGVDESAPTSRRAWLRSWWGRDHAQVARLGGRWTAGSSSLARLTVPLLFLAALSGPAAVMLSWTSARSDPVVPAVVGDTPDLAARRVAAEETALGWVLAWLGASRADSAALKRWWSGSELRLPDVGAQVSAARVLQSTAVAPGVWSVLVAADVSTGVATQRRYFQVPVAVSGGEHTAAARALTIPAEVSAPGTDASAQLAYTTGIPVSSPPGATVAGFLTALLTGTGDLSRWSSPANAARAVTPPVCRSVTVQAIVADRDVPGLITGNPTDGDSVALLVTADLRAEPAVTTPATTPGPSLGPSGAPMVATGQWLLSITARAGRWEVASIDLTPALSQ